MSIAAFREGIGKNLATIRGLRVAVEIPDNPSPPVAIVALQSVSYDGAFHGGLTEYQFAVSMIVGRAAEREAQRRLDVYVNTGEGGVKYAIESDRQLGGSAYDVRVSEMTQVGSVSLGDATYLACDFLVTVYAE